MQIIYNSILSRIDLDRSIWLLWLTVETENGLSEEVEISCNGRRVNKKSPTTGDGGKDPEGEKENHHLQ